MCRRLLGFAIILGASVLGTAGCQGLRQAIRSSDDEKEKAATKGQVASESTVGIDSDPTKIPAVDADAKNPQPFFKGNRPAGGWSSEAREIESHFGIK